MKYIRTPKPKREKSQIPFRLNFLFFIVFLLFAALVGQLAYLQILNGSRFVAEVDRTDKLVVTGNVPRGLIFDSQGRPLVTNKANSAITYTKSVGVTGAQMRKLADKLATYISEPTDGLQPRDYADYYLADDDYAKEITTHLSKADQALATTKPTDFYTAQVDYVKAHLPADKAKVAQAAAIFKIMNGATQLSTVYIKSENVSETEVATVGENLTSMPGINLGTDWQRNYPNGDSMTSIIGRVSTEKAGLPADGLQTYLANGYARNDRVGTSYLEKEYENVLKGAKSQTQVEVGNNNQIVQQIQEFKGQQGANLNLTIDSAYQAKVEAILKSTFKQALAAGNATYSDGAYAVAMDPKTGKILALAGENQNIKTHELTDDALGAINRVFVMGSAVKGATVLGALQDGVISVNNNTLSDVPIYLPGTPVKKSVYPVGTFSSLDAPMALSVSSNIYMMRLAMAEGHAKYSPSNYLSLDNDIFTKMRKYFSEFGLGQATGIDLPGEASSFPGPTKSSDGKLAVGSALDLSYGNYDPYTLIQMAQYISTIANNGYRMQPYLVQSISQMLSDGSKGPILSTTQPKVLAKVGSTQSQIDLVKQGMWQVVHGTNGWTTATPLNTLNPGVAGKTGTAQTFTRVDPDDSTSKQIETTTLSFVGFAPAKDPKIAIAVVVPNLQNDPEGYNLTIAKQMFSDYYAMNNIKADSSYSAHQTSING
ncbi:peptidoglycan D,D-transpeptidase FtsI family protein [Lacticaseibacillus brantae]|uniref:Penicillin-binding protein, transpeptidase domain protein n=1 Tax=Lacticaseibacillus brantae DSM 23927 TaxID=1423727 RepID=A0A0R2B195_9LACO|nr:penicillin-binding protein 2 [Lacticaseibacillus brantae]KRM72842.1 penicillin-binding protein, transpeptidase domain protein [Lacticaseibacillus brantae DSM 23927]